MGKIVGKTLGVFSWMQVFLLALYLEVFYFYAFQNFSHVQRQRIPYNFEYERVTKSNLLILSKIKWQS